MGYSIVGAQAVGLCNRAESLIVARPNGTADKGVAYDGSLQHLPSRLYLSFKVRSSWCAVALPGYAASQVAKICSISGSKCPCGTLSRSPICLAVVALLEQNTGCPFVAVHQIPSLPFFSACLTKAERCLCCDFCSFRLWM